MRQYKIKTKEKLEVGEQFYAKRFSLTVDRSRCKGCQLCQLVCPRDAITIEPTRKGPDGKALPPLIDIDEKRCDFHGICDVVCPFSAIRIDRNGQQDTPAVSKDAFPTLIRDITVDTSRCQPECRRCEEKCPLGALTVHFEPLQAEERAERVRQGLPDTDSRTVVDISKELCAGCQICWMECPTSAINVTKFYDGNIRIHPDRCPEGCRNCLDVCPVDALDLDDNQKVYARDLYCIYCGACLNVCPEAGALEVERTSVRHTAVLSGAWNKALEKLTSSTGMDRELAAKRATKAREAIINRKVSR